MSFLTKWHKLRKNPKAFFRDSKLNALFMRRKYANTVTVQSTPAHSSVSLVDNPQLAMQPFEGEFNFDYLIQILKENNVCAVYILPVSDNLKPTLAILHSEKANFLNCLLRLLAQENIGLRYKLQNKIIRPTSVSEVWQDWVTTSQLDVRLSTNRITGNQQSQFWFKVEFVSEQEDHFMFPSNNHLSRKLWKHTAQQYKLFQSDVRNLALILNGTPHETSITFDVDLVFTWVNAADTAWQEMYLQYKPDTDTDANSTSRFYSRDELKYALRSWEKYGNFVRKIFIVSNCAPPTWLDLSHPKLVWIEHEQIMPADTLPTFSSHAIEACLHKIPNLSKYWIYSNDDILLTKPVDKHTFFHHNGIAKLRLENYGNVNGQLTEHEPDYMNAARNGNRLLQQTFGKTPTALHTHSPQSMRTDVLEEMNHLFEAEFRQTINNKFRHIHDISVTSYFYQHYALLSGKALESQETTEMVIARHNFRKKFQDILKSSKDKAFNTLPLSVCINDGADSHLNEQWNSEVMHFLTEMFPERSSFEHN